MKIKKILIIDDSAPVRVLLKDWLQNESIEVIEESDGLMGYERIRAVENELDLIIVDVHMPGLDGISMLKMLKEHNFASGIPKIILTTEISKSHKSDIKNETENVRGWILKPVNKTIIENVIKKIDPDWDFN